MQENFVFPHKISRFLILKDYQKDLGQVDIKGGNKLVNKFLLDGKSINWSLEEYLELAKKENLPSLFAWVFYVEFNCIVLLTVSFPNISDTVS